MVETPSEACKRLWAQQEEASSPSSQQAWDAFFAPSEPSADETVRLRRNRHGSPKTPLPYVVTELTREVATPITVAVTSTYQHRAVRARPAPTRVPPAVSQGRPFESPRKTYEITRRWRPNELRAFRRSLGANSAYWWSLLDGGYD